MLLYNGQIGQKKIKTGRGGGIRRSFHGFPYIYRYSRKKRGLEILFSKEDHGKCGEDVSAGFYMG